jgi:hypothetical protein
VRDTNTPINTDTDNDRDTDTDNDRNTDTDTDTDRERVTDSLNCALDSHECTYILAGIHKHGIKHLEPKAIVRSSQCKYRLSVRFGGKPSSIPTPECESATKVREGESERK